VSITTVMVAMLIIISMVYVFARMYGRKNVPNALKIVLMVTTLISILDALLISVNVLI
jgi:heme/copper-type cytochrome/quinol oxidase subunit 3